MDFGDFRLKNECSGTVHLIDLNDNPPKFIQKSYSVKYNSLNANNSIIKIEAFDEDSNSEIIYLLNDSYKLFKVIIILRHAFFVHYCNHFN